MPTQEIYNDFKRGKDILTFRHMYPHALSLTLTNTLSSTHLLTILLPKKKT
jgi:hypothetical protein